MLCVKGEQLLILKRFRVDDLVEVGESGAHMDPIYTLQPMEHVIIIIIKCKLT
jgi:hypothetical protein